MKDFKKLAAIVLLTPLFAACSDAPSGDIVEGLIEEQYEQVHSIVDNAAASAGDDEMAQAMSGMMSSVMPKLESVGDVNCASAEDEDTYRCIAEITHSINGNTETKKVNFLVYKINDEWAIGG